MNKKIVEQVIVPLFIIALCVFFWTQLADLPEPRFEPMGAALYPKAILAAIIALTVLDMILSPWEDRRKARLAKENSEMETKTNGEPATKPLGFKVPIIVSAMFSAYVLLISYTDIPYVILTFAFVTLACWYLAHFKKRALFFSIFTAALITAFIYLVFGVAMETILP